MSYDVQTVKPEHSYRSSGSRPSPMLASDIGFRAGSLIFWLPTLVESGRSRMQEADAREVGAACDRWHQQSGRGCKPCSMAVLAEDRQYGSGLIFGRAVAAQAHGNDRCDLPPVELPAARQQSGVP